MAGAAPPLPPTSLLAAFHVLDDTNYLKEAATNFPDNPQVELTVLTRNVFPDDRRKWLDLYKASSPSNSLANYLSAQTYFQNGQSDAAVKDLVAATGKPDFENYTLESQLDTEELGLFCGESALKSVETALASSSRRCGTGNPQTTGLANDRPAKTGTECRRQ